MGALQKRITALKGRVCLRFCAGMLLLCQAVHADILVLDNGESLSGTFSRIRENTLVFRTSLEGQMMTPMSEVQALTVASPLFIRMTDGRVFYGRLAAREGEQIVLPLDGSATVPLTASDIQETLPIPTPPAGTPDTETGLRLNVSPGVQWRSDSAAPVEPVLRLDAIGRKDPWTFSGEAVVERADPDRFPAYARVGGELLYESSDSVHPFLGVDFERDLDRALKHRTALSAGLYRALVAESNRSLSVMAALSAEQESRQEEQALLAGRRRHEKDALGVRLGLRFYRLFIHGHSLSETLTFFADFTNPGDVRARAETVYMLPVGNRLQLRLNLNIDYESVSYFRQSDRWSATVGAGINMAF